MKAYWAPTLQQDHETKQGQRKPDCADQRGSFPERKPLLSEEPRGVDGLGEDQ